LSRMNSRAHRRKREREAREIRGLVLHIAGALAEWKRKHQPDLRHDDVLRALDELRDMIRFPRAMTIYSFADPLIGGVRGPRQPAHRTISILKNGGNQVNRKPTSTRRVYE
jgi:hypothetical protein